MICKKIIVKGEVQGVGFRYFIKKEAERLGIKGYAMNKNEFVEIVAQGEAKQVEELIRICEAGSRFTNVTDIETIEIKIGDYKEFVIKH